MFIVSSLTLLQHAAVSKFGESLRELQEEYMENAPFVPSTKLTAKKIEILEYEIKYNVC